MCQPPPPHTVKTMTNSQLKAIVGGVAAALGTLDAQTDVLAAVLPPKYAGWLRTVVIVGGVVVMLFNQSLSGAHVSIPVEEAKALGVAPEQTKGT